MQSKIQVQGKMVDMNGDGMARELSMMVKEQLVMPFLSMELECFDLSESSRRSTDEKVTEQAARALQQNKVGVKCSSSADGPLGCASALIRHHLGGGTMISEPVLAKNVARLVPSWTSPVCIARHSYADQYSAVDFMTE